LILFLRRQLPGKWLIQQLELTAGLLQLELLAFLLSVLAVAELERDILEQVAQAED
jgi:hypothetical protein